MPKISFCKSINFPTYVFYIENPVVYMSSASIPGSKDDLEQIQGFSSIRIGNCDVANFANAFGFTSFILVIDKSIVDYVVGCSYGACWTEYIKNHFQGPGSGKRAVF